jgi:polar amino acid transport system substrate-binding protein
MVTRSFFRHRASAWLALALPALMALGRPAAAADIVAYTEESAPYHYTVNGKIIGSAADRLRAACELAKLSCSLEILPWARAMAMTRQHPNTLLFSIVRSPDREKEFLWLSSISTEPIWIFGRPDSRPVSWVADLAGSRVGVINGSSGAAFLAAAGVPRASIDYANSTEANLRKFAAHRIEFILSTEGRLEKELTRFELPFKVQKVLRMQDAVTYYAMNAQSSPQRVAALQAALQELKARDKSK